MNITALTGFIATDIELRQAGDTSVTTINLAVRDEFKKDLTHFLRVEAWGKTAELLEQYCHKGSKIGVTGSLKVDRFQDKEGNNREMVKVNANSHIKRKDVDISIDYIRNLRSSDLWGEVNETFSH